MVEITTPATDTKVCTSCGDEKPLTSFHRRSSVKDGRQSTCKSCRLAYQKATSHKRKEKDHRYNISEKGKASKLRWKAKNAQKDKELKLKYSRSEQGIQKQKAYVAANLAKYASIKAKYRAAKRNATPKWLTEDDFWFLEEIYSLCELRSKLTKVAHHVDHVIPLQGEKVCGLHVPQNLQILTAYENISKSNSYVIN